MQLTAPEKIRDFTARGWWGDDTLGTLFARTVDACPDRLALVDPPNRTEFTDGEPQRLTYKQLHDAVLSLACVLYGHGLRKDDIVVAQLPNIAEFTILYLAAAQLGLIVSPVPVQYGEHELGSINAALLPAAFVAVSNFKGSDLVGAHGSAFPNARKLVWGGTTSPGAQPLAAEPGARQREEFAAYRDGLKVSANDIFTICWTSGTTGTPKGVPRSHNHWLAIAICAGDLAGIRQGDVLLNPFPMVNMAALGGFLYNWLQCAGTLVSHHPLDLGVFLGQIPAEQVTYTIAPPAVLNMLLGNEALLDSVDLSSIRAIGSGSAPLAPWMVAGYQARGIPILNNFGSNEGMCLASGPQDVPDPADRAQYFPRFGVTGYHWANRVATRVQTKLVDPNSGQEITDPGHAGELLFWGPTIFDGYWGAPEANTQVFDADGFFRTGDLFEIAGEKRQFYRFVGRCKDIIVRGGVNISPDELDALLAGHPPVSEAAVFAYPDTNLGERVGVAVVPKRGESVTLEGVVDFLKQQGVAVFKLPERIEVLNQLPRNALGKVLRRELSAAFRTP
jgi:acyl-CoA synthetase (AMP-forming)/AMP-acid ligase II